MRFLFGVLTLFSFSLATAAIAAESNSNANQPAAAFIPVVPATTQPDSMKVIKGSGGVSTSYSVKSAPLHDDFVLGDPKAPVIMVEYASMTCPHCAHFANTTFPELEKKYIQTGKMSYVLRQFPLNEAALKAAMLLECVGDQNSAKYYVFARVLFDAQNKWAFDANYMSGLETIAMVGGLSREQFSGCINNTDREMRILKQKKLAVEEVKVPATPYIFIGGEVYAGDRTLEAMSAFIDAKLAQVTKK
jgi:protein-disulfide isomerase